MELAPGIIVGERYRLDALLGAGAMGSVWTATDVKLGRQVALKVLHADLRADPELNERFRREARLLAGVDHPAVVRVLDVLDIVDDEGRVRPCIVMAQAPGRTLADMVRQDGPLKLDHAVAVMRSLLDGLAAAHAVGIVHRDLKPQNVMVEERGANPPQVRLLDFGIAKGVQEAPSSSMLATRAGMLLGTPAYMSPEQINEPSRVDARADLWAATVCFFEMLTGHVPFPGRTMAETIANVLTGARLAASSFNPMLPGAVDGFFARTLAADLDARPRDAAALWTSLEPLAFGLDRTRPMDAASAQALVANAMGAPPSNARLGHGGTVRYGSPSPSSRPPPGPPPPSQPPPSYSAAPQPSYAPQPSVRPVATMDDSASFQRALKSNAVMVVPDAMTLARVPSQPARGFGALQAPAAGTAIQPAAQDGTRAMTRAFGIGAAVIVAGFVGACFVAIVAIAVYLHFVAQ